MEPEQQHGTSTTSSEPPGPLPGWEQVVDAMPQLVWIADGEGRVWFYNQRVGDYSGPFQDDDGSWVWRPLVHVDDSDATSDAWERAVETVGPYVCEHRIRMADGTYRWHVSRAIPVRTAGAEVTWVGTATDIHDRALAEERSRRSEQRLARVIDGLFSFVGLLGVDGTLLEVNESALRVGGMRRDEAIGLPLWDTYWWSHDEAVQARLRAAVEQAARGVPSRYDVEVRVAGGRTIVIDFQLVPLVEDGEITALIPSATDITDRVVERHRLDALADLSHQLNGASTPGSVTDAICALAPGAVGADRVHVALLDELAATFRVAMGPIQPDVVREWTTIPVAGDPTPLSEAVRTGKAIFLDPVARAERYPQTVTTGERLHVAASATVPLRTDSGEALGALWCAWHEPTDFDPPLRARLQLLADLCSQALARSQRSDVHDRLVHELQARLLAGEEAGGDLDVSVGYEPAQAAIGFGGDWYDVVRLDEAVTAFVVGDVAGHGIAAAAEMATTKATVRATLLSAGRADVLPLASQALGHLGSGFVASVAAAWVDEAAGTVEWRLAGHPPPVLRTPAGPARLLEGAHHPPLGMPTEPRSAAPVDFPPGSVLVLYTDGLVERPGDDLAERLEDLRRAVDAFPDDVSAADARDQLMGGLLVERASDDVAIVVVVRPR